MFDNAVEFVYFNPFIHPMYNYKDTFLLNRYFSYYIYVYVYYICMYMYHRYVPLLFINKTTKSETLTMLI